MGQVNNLATPTDDQFSLSQKFSNLILKFKFDWNAFLALVSSAFQSSKLQCMVCVACIECMNVASCWGVFKAIFKSPRSIKQTGQCMSRDSSHLRRNLRARQQCCASLTRQKLQKLQKKIKKLRNYTFSGAQANIIKICIYYSFSSSILAVCLLCAFFVAGFSVFSIVWLTITWEMTCMHVLWMAAMLELALQACVQEIASWANVELENREFMLGFVRDGFSRLI